MVNWINSGDLPSPAVTALSMISTGRANYFEPSRLPMKSDNEVSDKQRPWIVSV